MKYYKDEEGAIYAYELDGSQDSFIPANLKRMTKREVASHFSNKDGEASKVLAKFWRDQELARADLELNKVLDGMGTGTEQEWRDYRCKLRNWPDSKSFPKTKPQSPDA